ncbi:MAG: hypothetical protein ACPGUX_11930 [Halocynthiibacter sp.]
MNRVLLHLGFHKTGTTTAQAFLRENFRIIRQVCVPVLRRKMKTLYPEATEFSRTGQERELRRFRRKFTALLEELPLQDDLQVLISEENLIGQMPGKFDVWSYDTAPILLGSMLECIRDIFPEPAEVTVLFSTRDAESWARSVWKHTLLADRLTLDLKTMREKLKPASDHQAVLSDLRKEFPKIIFVENNLTSLDDTEFGPATPMVDWLRMPPELRQTLRRIAPQNTSPTMEMAQHLLDLNRSDLNDDELADIKHTLKQEIASLREARQNANTPIESKPDV